MIAEMFRGGTLVVGELGSSIKFVYHGTHSTSWRKKIAGNRTRLFR